MNGSMVNNTTSRLTTPTTDPISWKTLFVTVTGSMNATSFNRCNRS